MEHFLGPVFWDVLEKSLGDIPGLNSTENGLANNGSGPNSFVSSGPKPLDIGVCFSEPIDGAKGELGQGVLDGILRPMGFFSIVRVPPIGSTGANFHV